MYKHPEDNRNEYSIKEERSKLLEKVFERLAAQGTVARVGGSCKYRTDNGLMCAVGVLIPEDKYDFSFEGCVPPSEEDLTPDEALTEHYPVGCTHRALLTAAGINIFDAPVMRLAQKLHDNMPQEIYSNERLFVAYLYGGLSNINIEHGNGYSIDINLLHRAINNIGQKEQDNAE